MDELIVMKTVILSVVYFITGFLFLLLQHQIFFLPAFIFKSLIIPVLLILFFVNAGPIIRISHRLMLAGLFFSWAGDVTLELVHLNENIFVLGLSLFLLAHIIYFILFITTPGKNIIRGKGLFLVLPLIIYGSVLICYLYNDLGSMSVPVIIYAVVILTMIAGAINRFEKVNRESYYMVLSGAILFVISDSAIAINKFSLPFESSAIVVMSTYLIAQYLIVMGYVQQFR